jgi:hypothetical protein
MTAFTGLPTAVTALQQLVAKLGTVAQTLSNSFPQVTGTAPTATAGTATLPSNPVGFITVTLPSGASVKVPYYGG